MANTKVKRLRRLVARSCRDLIQVVDNFSEIQTTFNEFHPEWMPLFNAIQNNCIMTIGFIKTMSIRAWGYFPEQLDTWLK